MFFDPLYLLFAIPGLIIAGLASFYVQSTFSEYSHFRASSGLTGAQAAAQMLHSAGIYDVKIERVDGFLSDHYDPSSRTLRLSGGVYDSDSLSAIGVACHEAGHALQDAAAYAPLGLRSALVPITNISSWLSYLVIFMGFIFQSGGMVMFGSILFSAVVVFSIVTLPVEWDASARAKQLMVTAGIVSAPERDNAGKVLNAAFLTYVAAVLSSLLTLLYYLIRAAGMNRD
ncbi:MAG: zinc metallopeptidase [Lentisphaeria bacterium]|nr:zinc metallopeptidase [Lentisphaeria bacterium]